jgi:hypothetical protein
MYLLYIFAIILTQILVFWLVFRYYYRQDKPPKENTNARPSSINAHQKINKGMISIDSASTFKMLEKMKQKLDELENQNKPRDPNIVDENGESNK